MQKSRSQVRVVHNQSGIKHVNCIRNVLYRTPTGSSGMLSGRTLLQHAPIPLMPRRRLEDRIRDLCTRLVASSERDFDETLAELQAAITLRIQNNTSAIVLGWPEFPQDRRKKPAQ
jgi:hypothetical protein